MSDVILVFTDVFILVLVLICNSRLPLVTKTLILQALRSDDLLAGLVETLFGLLAVHG